MFNFKVGSELKKRGEARSVIFMSYKILMQWRMASNPEEWKSLGTGGPPKYGEHEASAVGSIGVSK